MLTRHSFRMAMGLGITGDDWLDLKTKVDDITMIASPLPSGLEASAVRAAQYTNKSVLEGLPELLKVLQEIASIHPFLGRTSRF